MAFASTLHIFISVLCDNLLMTVVVPILPELLGNTGNDVPPVKGYQLASGNNNFNSTDPNQHNGNGSVGRQMEDKEKSDELAKDCLQKLFHLHMLHENSQLGLLFSTKALVQLFANPLVGSLTFKVGYKIPLCIGNFILFLCSLVFAFANSYGLFVVGRSFHGLASSLISVSGMALVAEAHPVDEERTRFLGRVMGAAALGVLIGYPFGGITFSIFGKAVPFLTIAVMALANVVFQITKIQKYDIIKTFHPDDTDEYTQLPDEEKILIPTNILTLFKDKSIKIISVAICLSTTAMAVLEPTLPVWLMEYMNPPKWQLGLVFVPDSLGYFVGTNFFGEISLRFGRWKTSMISMATLGVSCFTLPMARHVWELSFPHFTLGLGLGVVDASLMPLLARLADDKFHAGYGAVYALAQTSVALAYSLGPLLGGELVPLIGFPDLIRSVGFLNLLFCPFLFFLSHVDLRRVRSISSEGTEGGSDDVRENDYNRFNRSTFPKDAREKCQDSMKQQISALRELFPLKSYESRYIQFSSSSLTYQRFNDQLDSD